MPPAHSVQAKIWDIGQLPGLSASHQSQLRTRGIHTTGQLLQHGRTPAARQQLAANLQLHPQYVNRWIALADLAQLPSVGCHYCGLLLHAGVSSPRALASMSLSQLQPRVQRFVTQILGRRERRPEVPELACWIREAQALTASSTSLRSPRA